MPRTLLVGFMLFVFLAGSSARNAAALQPSPQGSISGLVTEKSTGMTASGVLVTAKPITSYGACEGTSSYTATTDLDGYYTISALPDGPYRVSFSLQQSVQFVAPIAAAPNYITQWYNGGADETKGSIIQVNASGAVKNINAILEQGGSLSGNLSDANGPLGFANVTATNSTGVKTSTTTDFSGNYTIRGLASGSYTVSFKSAPPLFFFDPPIPGFTSVQYLPVQYPSPIVVTVPNDTPAINMLYTSAQAGGSISGSFISNTGTVPGFVMISVRAAGSTTFVTNTIPFDGTGQFTLGGLESGTYDLVVNDMGSQNSYSSQKISGIVVTRPNTVNVAPVVLQPGGQISGIVTNSVDSTPLQNVFVVAANAQGMGGFALTATNGSYSIGGLGSGNYSVQFSLCSGGYVEQWYNNKTSQPSSDIVAVTAPGTRSAINASISLAGANVSPVAKPQNIKVLTNISRAISLSAQDKNADHLTYSVVAPPLHGVLSGTPPNIVYTPANNYSGPDQFTFKANDGKVDSNFAAISIDVSAAVPAKKGDVNGDGAINIIDALLALQYYVGLIPATPEFLYAADVAPLDPVNQIPKGNNTVDMVDVLSILRRALNLDPWLPAGGGTTLALVSPHDGATNVAPGTTVLVSTSKLLDSATINRAVTFQQTGPYGTSIVAGTARFDTAQQQIIFSATDLQADYLYSLVFSGLKDLGGFSVADAAFTFKTGKNPFTRSASKYPDGTIYKYDDCSLNTAGDPLFCSYYTGPGVDGTWFTSDDPVLFTEAYSYNVSGSILRKVVYDNPGPDLNWFTTDDHVLSYSEYNYDPQGKITRFTRYYGAGTDGTWFTGDDKVGFYESYLYDTNSRISRVITYRDAGVDGIWFTPDDVVSEYEDYDYDTFGRLSGIRRYSDAGTDTVWFTADDALAQYNKKIRNLAGQVLVELYSSTFDPAQVQSGGGIWSIGDIFKYNTYEYNAANGRIDRIKTFGHVGDDALWNTADDIMASYCNFSYDGTNRKTGKTCYNSPGPNGVWFDADDRMYEYDVFTSP